VPSCRHCGTVEKSHYALQDRHFRLSTRPDLGNFAKNPG
jgi:hypothetical protein